MPEVYSNLVEVQENSNVTTKTCKTLSSRLSRVISIFYRRETGSGSPAAAIQIAVDLAEEGFISRGSLVVR